MPSALKIGMQEQGLDLECQGQVPMRQHVLQSPLEAVRGRFGSNGPTAAFRIQGVVAILQGMHIHPALSEVVEEAFGYLMSPEAYHHLMSEEYGLPIS